MYDILVLEGFTTFQASSGAKACRKFGLNTPVDVLITECDHAGRWMGWSSTGGPPGPPGAYHRPDDSFTLPTN